MWFETHAGWLFEVKRLLSRCGVWDFGVLTRQQRIILGVFLSKGTFDERFRTIAKAANAVQMYGIGNTQVQ